MFNLHLNVGKRLLTAWLIVSLVVGLSVYFYEMEKVDDQIVDIAIQESRDFLPNGMNEALSQADIDTLTKRANYFVGKNFIVIEIYSRAEQKILEAVNPKFFSVEEQLALKKHKFPHDQHHHYEKFLVDGVTVVQVMVPIRNAQEALSGFFEGVYVVSESTLTEIERQLWHTVIWALLAVLITTLILYPVMITLNRDVMRFSREVIQGNLEMASVLGSAIALRDSDTGSHNYRVTLYAIRLAEALKSQTVVDMKSLILGAFLHDVGKIGISDNILLKPGKLTEEEFDIMRTHVELGVQIVSTSPWLECARDVIEFHHEKFNGRGYLKGISGENIPLTARLFAVVDVFDALTSKRPYKEPMPFERVMEILQQDSGTHFDPVIIAVFRLVARDLFGRYGNTDESVLRTELNELASSYYLAPSLALLDKQEVKTRAEAVVTPGGA